MTYKPKFTIIRQWIFFPFFISMMSTGLLMVIIDGLFALEFNRERNLAIFFILFFSQCLYFYIKRREIMSIELSDNSISIEYHDQCGRDNIDLKHVEITEIEVYKSKAFNEVTYYHIGLGNVNRIYFDAHTVPLKDLDAYCKSYGILLTYKE